MLKGRLFGLPAGDHVRLARDHGSRAVADKDDLLKLSVSLPTTVVHLLVDERDDVGGDVIEIHGRPHLQREFWHDDVRVRHELTDGVLHPGETVWSVPISV